MKTTKKSTFHALLFLLLIGLFSACATSKNAAYSPAGTWEYEVQNTPYGNVKGQLIISQEGDGYTGELRSSMGNVSLRNLSIEENKQMNATAMMDGTSLSLSGMFEGDTFQGSVSAGSDGPFPMTASRGN